VTQQYIAWRRGARGHIGSNVRRLAASCFGQLWMTLAAAGGVTDYRVRRHAQAKAKVAYPLQAAVEDEKQLRKSSFEMDSFRGPVCAALQAVCACFAVQLMNNIPANMAKK
jgi:hypothetical protein